MLGLTVIWSLYWFFRENGLRWTVLLSVFCSAVVSLKLDSLKRTLPLLSTGVVCSAFPLGFAVTSLVSEVNSFKIKIVNVTLSSLL